ncbi:serine/threonine-protein kinase [Micromonospora sp. RTP1Z1]|uniref:serine/threonine-protein kinase n=1 Tax=Micromonospora sp. RTP1Z1 TaxID=2994043 RepID=UPI0029C66B70|nr:serine/threonine-protein kinase [Micromonospora sp. RTP1Z1]
MTAPVQIGSYRIERLLGVGSFAMVWLGYDSALDSHVAIKVLAENWSHDLRVRERFLDEARLLRWLDHERLVRVHAVGELADGRPYSVMAWADGGSLRDRLARGPLPAATAVRLLGEIAAGVAVLHRYGIVHRDLTPGNILFRSGTPEATGAGPAGEQVLIADLGLAKALAAASGLTARAGTPGYMAPEQDDPLAVVDTRADVFGLGRLGFRLLGVDAGRPGSGVRLRDGVPPRVAAVLGRATAAHPADRHPDAAAFRAALNRATPDGQGRAYAAPRRYRVKVAGVAVVVVAAVGGTTAEPGGTTTGTGSGGPGSATHTSGPITVTLPAGWRATGEGWAGRYADDGNLEPALVMSPEPRRWAADSALPGAFVGLSASTAARTTPAGFVAEHPHADCIALPARATRQAGVDWVVVTFSCDRGRPVIVEAAGLGPGRTGLVYVQITPPAGSGPDFVDTLLAGVRVR